MVMRGKGRHEVEVEGEVSRGTWDRRRREGAQRCEGEAVTSLRRTNQYAYSGPSSVPRSVHVVPFPGLHCVASSSRSSAAHGQDPV